MRVPVKSPMRLLLALCAMFAVSAVTVTAFPAESYATKNKGSSSSTSKDKKNKGKGKKKASKSKSSYKAEATPEKKRRNRRKKVARAANDVSTLAAKGLAATTKRKTMRAENGRAAKKRRDKRKKQSKNGRQVTFDVTPKTRRSSVSSNDSAASALLPRLYRNPWTDQIEPRPQ